MNNAEQVHVKDLFNNVSFHKLFQNSQPAILNTQLTYDLI